MASETMFVEGDEVKQVEMIPGVLRRTLGHGAQMLLAEFNLAAGSELPMHSHPHDQVGYVVRGSMRLTIGDDARTCEAGDSYYIPGDVPHKAVTVEDALVIDVFCPPREDYLEG
jgi:quercetin dioxygenase-like cupin family protein